MLSLVLRRLRSPSRSQDGARAIKPNTLTNRLNTGNGRASPANMRFFQKSQDRTVGTLTMVKKNGQARESWPDTSWSDRMGMLGECASIWVKSFNGLWVGCLVRLCTGTGKVGLYVLTSNNH
jgi:hypothetical protein